MITILNIIIIIIVVHNSWQWRWKDCDPIEGKWSPGHPGVRRRAWRSASIKLGHFYYRSSWSSYNFYYTSWWSWSCLKRRSEKIKSQEWLIMVIFSRLICFAKLWSDGDGGHHQREGGGGGSLIDIASQMILHHDRCFIFSIEMTWKYLDNDKVWMVAVW